MTVEPKIPFLSSVKIDIRLFGCVSRQRESEASSDRLIRTDGSEQRQGAARERASREIQELPVAITCSVAEALKTQLGLMNRTTNIHVQPLLHLATN